MLHTVNRLLLFVFFGLLFTIGTAEANPNQTLSVATDSFLLLDSASGDIPVDDGE